MKRLQIIIGVLMIAMLSCTTNKPIEIDYCDMLKKDQSYVNYEEEDEQVRMENSKKRREIFVRNYKQIIQLTKEEGFPNVDFDSLPEDSCKYWGVTATLIHMAQSNPDMFFSEETITLFKEEMNKGNLDSEDLTPAFRISFMTNEFCDNLRESISRAVDVWDMEPYLNTEPKFKPCN